LSLPRPRLLSGLDCLDPTNKLELDGFDFCHVVTL
jgi:hypothetical protein